MSSATTAAFVVVGLVLLAIPTVALTVVALRTAEAYREVVRALGDVAVVLERLCGKVDVATASAKDAAMHALATRGTAVDMRESVDRAADRIANTPPLGMPRTRRDRTPSQGSG